MPRATLTSKGQTTIPVQVRERLGLRQGDTIDFVFQTDGSVAMRSIKHDVHSLKGLLHEPGRRSVSIAEMKTAVRQTAVKRFLRPAESSRDARLSPAPRGHRRRS